MKKVFYGLVASVIFIACNDQSEKNEVITGNKDNMAIPLNKDSLLSATGNKILTILKTKQYDSLVKYFAPADSIHFAPYASVGSGEQTLSAADFTKLLSSDKAVKWGEYEGTGDPINLTVKQYMEKFVYNADFLKAEKTAIDSFIGAGNSVNNLKQFYPNARFIEYYFSGFDKKYEGLDWTSLRLVFKEMDNKYYLIAIVHDQWTI